MGYGFKVMAEGDYACFTRPELKVERVSYDVPTPGAIEGMLKSVYWRPAVRYVIDRIIVFNPINFMNVRRNEVKEKVSFSGVKSRVNGSGRDISVYTADCRTQRASMILKNVKYGIEFHFELTGFQNEKETDGEKKHYNIIKRRLINGQHFRTPCFGCSEFPVGKLSLTEHFDLSQISSEILSLGDVDLGYMLYRMKFADEGKPVNGDWENPRFSDRADAVYYRPHMIDGMIDVAKYAEELKC